MGISALTGYVILSLVFNINFTLDSEDVQFTQFRGEEVAFFPGGVSPFETGDPSLPGVTYSMVIPQGTRLEEVRVEVLSTVEFPDAHWIAPLLYLPLDQPLPVSIPHSENYSRGVFPSRPVLNIDTGSKTGFRIASFSFVPFTWDPSTGRLSVITGATLTAVTGEADTGNTALTDNQIRIAVRNLENTVQNPEMLSSYAPVSSGSTDGAPWVVIADETHEESLQPLIDLRAVTHGSQFVSTQWIYANYSGRDTQEQIRNFLIDRFENQGLVYALIVGDFGETTRLSQLNINGTPMDAVSDLYFTDLDGSWDLDGDSQFGELNDGIDYYSDIYVGRFCTDITARLVNQVNKAVAYETSAPAGDWQTTALLAGAGLWVDDPPGYWGSFVCDSISNRIPDNWTIHQLYEDYDSHPDNQIDLINQGVSYCSINGHGNEGGVYWFFAPNTAIVTNSNYYNMTNTDTPAVFHSMACHPGHLQNIACSAERLMFWPQGGAIAVMYNSHWGIGSPPSVGPSEWLEIYFAEVLFQDQQYELGVAHAVSKDRFKAEMGMGMQYWILQENNFLGDPALRFVAGQMGVEEGQNGASTGLPVVSSPIPNPVAGNCAIGYNMPVDGSVQVEVYDVSGRVAATVYSGFLHAGEGSISFDGSSLPTGCYSVVLKSQVGSSSARMIILD